MIELIIAIATSSLLAAALIGTLADTERLSTAGQSQIIASAIAQEQIDNVRNTLYGNLVPGTYTLLVNRTNSAQSGPTNVNPRPLLMDVSALDWRTPTERQQGTSYIQTRSVDEFQGTVTETVSAAPAYPNTYQVTIQITWQEGTAQRNYSVSTLVAQNGIHIY